MADCALQADTEDLLYSELISRKEPSDRRRICDRWRRRWFNQHLGCKVSIGLKSVLLPFIHSIDRHLKLRARWIIFMEPLKQVVELEADAAGRLRGCCLAVSGDGTIAVITTDGFSL